MKATREDIPGQLVESRLIGRFYLSLLDIHSALTELMFRHAGETAAPNFPDKFLFLRNIMERNRHFLETYYDPTLQNTDHHLKETKVTAINILISVNVSNEYFSSGSQNPDHSQ